MARSRQAWDDPDDFWEKMQPHPFETLAQQIMQRTAARRPAPPSTIDMVPSGESSSLFEPATETPPPGVQGFPSPYPASGNQGQRSEFVQGGPGAGSWQLQNEVPTGSPPTDPGTLIKILQQLGSTYPEPAMGTSLMGM